MRVFRFLLIAFSLTLSIADSLRADDDPMCWTCNSCSEYLEGEVVEALSERGFYDDGLCKTVLPIYADGETSISGSYGSLVADEDANQGSEYLRKCTYAMRSPNDHRFGNMVSYKGLSSKAPAVCNYLLAN